MSSDRRLGRAGAAAAALATALILGPALPAGATEIFIHRPPEPGRSITETGRVHLRGEIFGWLCAPSNLPGFNDATGPADRWNFGFQDRVAVTPSTDLLLQLLTHDDGGRRTKFDWHFDLHQRLLPHLSLILGHDSDHDSDHASVHRGRPYYANRNYIGVGFPIEAGGLYLEPFTWFFHNTNVDSWLDMSGRHLVQEFGLRAAVRLDPAVSLHLQGYGQCDAAFGPARTWVVEGFARAALAGWLQLSAGASFWMDATVSPAGRRLNYHKITWGIVIPF